MDFFSMLNNLNSATIKSSSINLNDCVSSMAIDQSVINFLVEKYDIRAMHVRKTKINKRDSKSVECNDVPVVEEETIKVVPRPLLKVNKRNNKNDKL